MFFFNFFVILCLIFCSYMKRLIAVLDFPFHILFYFIFFFILFIHFRYCVSPLLFFPRSVSANQSIVQLIWFIDLRNFDQQTAAQNTLTFNRVDLILYPNGGWKNKYKNRTNWAAITFTCQKMNTILTGEWRVHCSTAWGNNTQMFGLKKERKNAGSEFLLC